MKKRVISILLVVLMLVSLLPIYGHLDVNRKCQIAAAMSELC